MILIAFAILLSWVTGLAQTSATNNKGWPPSADLIPNLYVRDVDARIALAQAPKRQADASDPKSKSATDSASDLLAAASDKDDIYPANANARQEIDDALKRAPAEHKRVLLVFGANWCYDCHVLDRALHEGEAGKIVSEKYLLIHVNIGEGEKNAELVKDYKIPLDKGVPAVAVLDEDGKLLYSSGEGEFEAARRMLKADLVKFLTRWKAL